MKRRIIITMDANPEFNNDPAAIKQMAIRIAKRIDEGDTRSLGVNILVLCPDKLKNPCHVEIADITEYEDSRE